MRSATSLPLHKLASQKSNLNVGTLCPKHWELTPKGIPHGGAKNFTEGIVSFGNTDTKTGDAFQE